MFLTATTAKPKDIQFANIRHQLLLNYILLGIDMHSQRIYLNIQK